MIQYDRRVVFAHDCLTIERSRLRVSAHAREHSVENHDPQQVRADTDTLPEPDQRSRQIRSDARSVYAGECAEQFQAQVAERGEEPASVGPLVLPFELEATPSETLARAAELPLDQLVPFLINKGRVSINCAPQSFETNEHRAVSGR